MDRLTRQNKFQTEFSKAQELLKKMEGELSHEMQLLRDATEPVDLNQNLLKRIQRELKLHEKDIDGVL